MMNRETLLSFAWKALGGGAEMANMSDFKRATFRIDQLERFAAAVAAAVKEEDARICEETDVVDFEYCMVVHEDGRKTLKNAAAAIRASIKEWK